MNAKLSTGIYATTSRRVAATYQRMLSEFCAVAPAGLEPGQPAEMLAAQADLHQFFTALYDALVEAPEAFGMPAAEDVYLLAEYRKEGRDKTEVKRILDRQRKLVEEGLTFLRELGLQGGLEDAALALPAGSEAAGFLKKKSGRAWVDGMRRAGLALRQEGGEVWASNDRFPRMMPALKALAESCARCPDEYAAESAFARCDFRALRHEFTPPALELYRAFEPASQAWATGMHAYFTARGYQPMLEASRIYNWVVKYQGKKSIKGTPLFQVGFDDRYQQPMRVQIKCASAQRVIPLLEGQSPALREDFSHRMVRCGNCDWCRNQKTLGPTEFTLRGETRKVCWYVLPDLYTFTEETAALVKEYAQMHEGLG